MNLIEAKKLAEGLIQKHCPDYSFKFDNAKRRFGSCHWGKKYITLSRNLVKINSKERILLTIIHEIAHALTPSHNHDKVWKAKCIELGGNGIRAYSGKETICIEPRYIYKCPNCSRGIFYFRKKRKPIACGSCCNKYNNGKYDARFNYKYVGMRD